MQKKALLVGFVFVVTMAVCTTAFACQDGSCPVHGFFNSVGGFLYNALPWNWGNWMGQPSS